MIPVIRTVFRMTSPGSAQANRQSFRFSICARPPMRSSTPIASDMLAKRHDFKVAAPDKRPSMSVCPSLSRAPLDLHSSLQGKAICGRKWSEYKFHRFPAGHDRLWRIGKISRRKYDREARGAWTGKASAEVLRTGPRCFAHSQISSIREVVIGARYAG